MTSRVSVTSSPSSGSRAPLQRGQEVGPGTIRRSRGRCPGKGSRAGRCRVKGGHPWWSWQLRALPPARPQSPRLRTLRAVAQAGRADGRCARSDGRTVRAGASRSAASDGRSTPDSRLRWLRELAASAATVAVCAMVRSSSRASSRRFRLSASSGRASTEVIVIKKTSKPGEVIRSLCADSICRSF